MAKIIVQIPLTKYLKEIAKDWEEPYITKTYGDQVWLSDESPGEMYDGEEGPNYIEFNDSCVWLRLPKEVHQHIDLDRGTHKNLKEILKEIKAKESEVEE